jgi:hypothetical protein
VNLDSFEIEAVMIHDVPRGNSDDEHLTLTDEPIELGIDLRRYFRRKVLTSLHERGVEVVADENEENTVRTAVAHVIAKPADLALQSRTIAERLDSGVASFFLGTFLGGRLRDSPEKSTFEFVQAVDGFINEQVDSAERRGRCQVALLATMQDLTGEVRPRSFATAHLDAADRPAFLDRVRQMGLDPDTPFAKDTSLVKVSGFRMTFDSGMVLVGSQEDLLQRVKIRPDNAPKAGVDLNDAIKKLRGR